MAGTKAWVVIAVGDLDDYLVAAQMGALRSAALGDGQADPFAKVMGDVVGRVRNEVAACSRNVLSATVNSVPPELKQATCYLLIAAMQTRLPLKLSDDQKDQIERAEKLMLRVAKGEFPVSNPTDPEAAPVQKVGGGDYGGATRIAMRTEESE